jgi:hypothetical protein
MHLYGKAGSSTILMQRQWWTVTAAAAAPATSRAAEPCWYELRVTTATISQWDRSKWLGAYRVGLLDGVTDFRSFKSLTTRRRRYCSDFDCPMNMISSSSSQITEQTNASLAVLALAAAGDAKSTNAPGERVKDSSTRDRDQSTIVARCLACNRWYDVTAPTPKVVVHAFTRCDSVIVYYESL